MRTVPFKTLLHRLATKLGLDPATQLQRSTAAALSEHLAEAYEHCLLYHPWPESLAVVERTVSAAGMVPWAGLGTVTSVWAAHPMQTSSAEKLGWNLGPDGICVAGGASAKVWLVHRPEAPLLTAEEWDARRTYAPGAVVYLPHDGHCYTAARASAGSTPAAGSVHWIQQPLLRILLAATVSGGLSLARDEEGQTQTAQAAWSRMEEQLFARISELHNQQGQTLYTKLV